MELYHTVYFPYPSRWLQWWESPTAFLTLKVQNYHSDSRNSRFRRLWEDKATEAVLDFPRDTSVGCVVNIRRLPREEGGGEEREEGEGGIGEEDGPGPP